jgi:hypothetical protein
MTTVASGLHNSLKNYFQAMGIVAYAASQLLILLALLKSGGFRAAGDFALSQAIIAPVFGLAAFSLRPYWVSGVIRNFDMYQFLQLRIISIFGGSGMVFVIKLLVFPSVDISIFVMVFALKTFELISDAFYATLDVSGRSATAGKLLMAKALAIGVFGGACFLTDAPLTALPYALYFAILSVAILELFVVEFSLSAFVSSMSAKRLRLDSLVHVVSWASASSVVASVTGFLPRYFLEEFLGREAVGYYSVVAAPAAVVLMACTGLAQTELGRLSASHSRGDWPEFLGILSRRVFLLAGLVAAAACTFAGLTAVLGLLGQSLFRSRTGYEISVLLLLFFPLYLAQFLSYAVMPLARIRETFAIALASLLLLIPISPMLIPWNALYGAVAVSVVGGLVQTAGFLFLIYRYFPGIEKSPDDKHAVKNL